MFHYDVDSLCPYQRMRVSKRSSQFPFMQTRSMCCRYNGRICCHKIQFVVFISQSYSNTPQNCVSLYALKYLYTWILLSTNKVVFIFVLSDMRLLNYFFFVRAFLCSLIYIWLLLLVFFFILLIIRFMNIWYNWQNKPKKYMLSTLRTE